MPEPRPTQSIPFILPTRLVGTCRRKVIREAILSTNANSTVAIKREVAGRLEGECGFFVAGLAIDAVEAGSMDDKSFIETVVVVVCLVVVFLRLGVSRVLGMEEGGMRASRYVAVGDRGGAAAEGVG